MQQPWIEAVEKDAEGTLKLQPFFGNSLADLFNIYDRVVSGVAQGAKIGSIWALPRDGPPLP